MWRGHCNLRSLIIAITVLSALLVLAAVFFISQAPSPASPQLSPLVVAVDNSRTLPEFHLNATSRSGELNRDSLQGHWTYLVFGYTHCPDVCPATLAMLAAVTKQWGDARAPLVVFVSVDAPRDSMEVLKRYVPAFNPTFIGATGTDEALAPLIKELGAYYVRNAPDTKNKPNDYTVDHTSSVFLITPEGRLRAAFTMPMEATVVIRDSNLLMSRR